MAEGENKLPPFRKCRRCIVSPADWPHSRSLQKKRPVGQTASFQPTQHLFKSPHSSRCRPAAAAPTVFTRRRQSRTICRCAPGAFGRADVAIYISLYTNTLWRQGTTHSWRRRWHHRGPLTPALHWFVIQLSKIHRRRGGNICGSLPARAVLGSLPIQVGLLVNLFDPDRENVCQTRMKPRWRWSIFRCSNQMSEFSKV